MSGFLLGGGGAKRLFPPKIFQKTEESTTEAIVFCLKRMVFFLPS